MLMFFLPEAHALRAFPEQMKHIFTIFVLAALVSLAAPSSAGCTSAIITRTADGRPLIWKHRDTGNLDNSIRHFKGERYSFVGLVNSSSPGGEVWAGVNTAGFAVINTASYCLKDDDVPSCMMDREGILMYRALEICATVEDFRHFLDTLARPAGVEANFGCIDACGGAAWFETGNYTYVMRDLAFSGRGFDVVTNFSWSGDRKRWRGVERWNTAQWIFNGMARRGSLVGLHPLDIVDSLSRSYRQSVAGVDLVRDSSAFLAGTTGIVPDLDFIPRRSTSASVVIQGVAAGEDPSGAVLWAALGYPAVSVAVPVPVSLEDHVPEALSGFPVSGPETFCGLSTRLKDTYVFPSGGVSNASMYVDLRYVLGGMPGTASTLSCCRRAEREIRAEFEKVYSRFAAGIITESEYLSLYDRISEKFFGMYSAAFSDYVSGTAPVSTM